MISEETIGLRGIGSVTVIPNTIGRGDFEASQGAKSAHTGSMEAMSNAGVAQKRPALRGGPPLAGGVVAPRLHRSTMLPRRASPQSQIWASQLYWVYRDGPLMFRSELDI